MAEKKASATFPIDLSGNAGEKASEFAGELEKLRKKIEGGQDAIKSMSSALARLNQASVVDIAAARELKVKIQEQKDTVAQANLGILKLGSSYDSLSSKAKKLTKDEDELKKKLSSNAEDEAKKKTEKLDGALRSASPGVADLKDKVSGLWETLSASSALEIVAVGAIALVAALAAATVAVVAFGVEAAANLAKWIVESANAARSANLMRAAFAGSADDAARLGSQVDALAAKVATPKAELNDLATKLREGGLAGQPLVDTFNAIGQASAAGADKASAKIQEIIDRSKLYGRVAINPMELMGTGLKFDEIASALATSMHVGIDEARAALLQGRVKLGDAAAALRVTTEAKFGKLNAAKMLDLDVQFAKFKENLAGLVKDINLEPLLTDLQSLFALFSSSTVTGQGVKALLEAFGSGFVQGVHEATPVAKAFIEGLVLGALKLQLYWLLLRIQLRDTFSNSETLAKIQEFTDQIDGLGIASQIGEAALWGIGAAIAGLIGSFVFLTALVVGFVAGIAAIVTVVAKAGPEIMSLGSSILKGLLDPLSSGVGIAEAVGKFVGSLTGELKSKLGIHSPSALMHAEVGLPAGEGAVGGMIDAIGQGVPAAAEALEQTAPSMGGAASSRAAAAANSNGGATELHLHLHVDSKQTAEALTEPTNLSSLTKAIEEMLIARGIPVRR